MKRITILIVLLMIFITCLFDCKESVSSEESTYYAKYKSGQLVYVQNEPFIIKHHDEKRNTYWMYKINCTSPSCGYDISEKEISLKPTNYEKN